MLLPVLRLCRSWRPKQLPGRLANLVWWRSILTLRRLFPMRMSSNSGPRTLNPTRNGKTSFFPWEQVEQFTRRIETANVERKDARTIRALLAVSHFLEPRELNPMTHPKCGIRTLTGYPATPEAYFVAPSEVMQCIAEDDGLPLLTGGADLLRWGLLQPSERNFQGIASVRRLTMEHLKAWFSEVLPHRSLRQTD